MRRVGLADARARPGALTSHPALSDYVGRDVILGIRPEDLEDATLATDAPADRRLKGKVELTEALGSEIMVHFAVDAPPAVTEDVKELAGGHRRGSRAGSAIGAAAGQRRSWSAASARARA